MTTYVGLLRAVNLGGRSQISMEKLRDLHAGLGFGQVRSLLNSGNLVFSGDDQPTGAIEDRLERETAKQLDLRTDFFVRTLEEWARVTAANPFPGEAERDPSHLMVMFLKNAPAAPAMESLRAAVSGPEVIRDEGRQLYITYPAGIGRSRLTAAVIEGKLGTRGTGRNWNTVLKLQALARG